MSYGTAYAPRPEYIEIIYMLWNAYELSVHVFYMHVLRYVFSQKRVYNKLKLPSTSMDVT